MNIERRNIERRKSVPFDMDKWCRIVWEEWLDSKRKEQSMYQTGAKELAHYVYFYGNGNPAPMNRYKSNDPDVIGDQLSMLEACNIAGLVALTFGPTASTFIHGAVVEAARQAEERNMLFAICLDPWVARDKAAPDKTSAVVAALKHPDYQKILSARNYLPEHYVFDFNTGADKAKVEAAVPGIQILRLQQEFAWPAFQKGMSGDQSAWVAANLVQQFSLPTMQVPCLCPSFNDGNMNNPSVSAWDATIPARIAESQAGNFFNDQLYALKPAKYVQLVTANDYFERTAMESEWSRYSRERVGK